MFIQPSYNYFDLFNMQKEHVNQTQQTISLPSPCHYILSKQSTLQQLLSSESTPKKQCNLYLGGVQALNSQIIKNLNIQAVLTIMTEKEMKKTKLQNKVQGLSHINRHNTCMCHEQTDLTGYFTPAIEFINDSFNYKMNVLVHCKEGNCQSVALLMAYLVYKYKLDFQKAAEIVKSRRPGIKEFSQMTMWEFGEEEQKLHKLK